MNYELKKRTLADLYKTWICQSCRKRISTKELEPGTKLCKACYMRYVCYNKETIFDKEQLEFIKNINDLTFR